MSVVLGPGLNIKRHPLCGRNFEYLSEDPLLSGHLATAMVRGIQSQGVGACLKHFAVNNQESHRLVVDAVVDERTLRELYLSGFEYASQHSSPWSVMAAYNQVNGTYCCDNEYLLTTILRDEWGFDGLVISDWGATNDRVAGVRAGMDLEMPGSGGAFDDAVQRAVAEGQLTPAQVAACADRVLDLVARSPRADGAPANLGDHDDLARRAAAQSSVLLTNDGILPLDPGATVALIGAFAEHPRFQGSGSSLVNPTRVTTAAKAMAERAVTFDYAPGYDPLAAGRDDRLIAQAVSLARESDVAVVLAGLPGTYESEGFDRSDMNLPAQHDALIEAVCQANPRTVVVLSNGAPVAMPWVAAPAAILESYLGGQASGSALVDVLYGDVEPGGRLAETFPVRQSDMASDRNFPGQPHQVLYREGLNVGYRHLITAGVAPLFAFGHGLGYTTFEMGEPSLDRMSITHDEPVAVKLPVTNTGSRPGSTVVQVYRHDRTGRVPRPRRELAGFAKVHLDAGATTEVTIVVEPRAFAFYDVQSKTWQTPQGVRVGDRLVERGHRPCGRRRSHRRVHRTRGADDIRGAPVRPVRPYSRVSTIGEISGHPVGRLLRAVVLRVGGYQSAEDAATALMIERSVDEMPLRTVALFSQGKVNLGMIDGLVDILNGRPGAAMGRTGRSTGRALRSLVARATG